MRSSDATVSPCLRLPLALCRCGTDRVPYAVWLRRRFAPMTSVAPTSTARTPLVPHSTASNPVVASPAEVATAIVYSWESVPPPLVTDTVNVAEPAIVGVPEITPVAESNAKPAGRLRPTPRT